MFGYYTDEELSGIGFGALGKNVLVSRSSELVNVSNIFLGNNIRIDSFTVLAPSSEAKISIGDHVQICAYTILNGLASITLEDFSSAGPHCRILSSCDDFSGRFLTNATIPKKFLGTYSAPIILKRHSVITSGVTVLPGVVIAIGTVVGAHSLVTKSPAPFTIIAGIPARFIKDRNRNILNIEERFREE